MRRLDHILVLALATLLLAGCENGPPWGGGEEDAQATPRLDFGPTAAYERRLLFLGPGDDLPAAAVFDFTALADSAGIRRGLRARLARDGQWVPMLDAGWEQEPMREPWRIVPGGDLTLTVNDAGELAALIHRTEPRVRLSPGALIAESSPDAGTRLLLRQATLTTEDESLRGVLLDVQLGRAVRHPGGPGEAGGAGADTASGVGASDAPVDGAAQTGDSATGDAATEDAAASGEEADDPEAADSTGPEAGARATPVAWPGADALLLDATGYYAVLSMSAAGELAWVSQGEMNRLLRGVRIEPTAWSDTADGAGDGEARVPTTWRIGGPTGQLTGQLTTEIADISALGDNGALTALGYVLVSGWIEDGAVRRDVFGLVRHVR